jgi:hypothetical protein
MEIDNIMPSGLALYSALRGLNAQIVSMKTQQSITDHCMCIGGTLCTYLHWLTGKTPPRLLPIEPTLYPMQHMETEFFLFNNRYNLRFPTRTILCIYIKVANPNFPEYFIKDLADTIIRRNDDEWFEQAWDWMKLGLTWEK